MLAERCHKRINGIVKAWVSPSVTTVLREFKSNIIEGHETTHFCPHLDLAPIDRCLQWLVMAAMRIVTHVAVWHKSSRPSETADTGFCFDPCRQGGKAYLATVLGLASTKRVSVTCVHDAEQRHMVILIEHMLEDQLEFQTPCARHVLADTNQETRLRAAVSLQ